MKKFFIHYSAFCVMLLMVVGLWGFVSNYRIRGKQSVILFVGAMVAKLMSAVRRQSRSNGGIRLSSGKQAMATFLL